MKNRIKYRLIGLALLILSAILVVIAYQLDTNTALRGYLLLMGIASFFTAPIGLVLLFSKTL